MEEGREQGREQGREGGRKEGRGGGSECVGGERKRGETAGEWREGKRASEWGRKRRRDGERGSARDIDKRDLAQTLTREDEKDIGRTKNI